MNEVFWKCKKKGNKFQMSLEQQKLFASVVKWKVHVQTSATQTTKETLTWTHVHQSPKVTSCDQQSLPRRGGSDINGFSFLPLFQSGRKCRRSMEFYEWPTLELFWMPLFPSGRYEDTIEHATKGIGFILVRVRV